MAAVHEKADVLYFLFDNLVSNLLNSHFRSITVVNAIMPSLEDGFEVLFELVERLLSRISLFKRRESAVRCGRDTE